MNAKKCDRCGKYYDEYNQNSKHNGICFCRKSFMNVAHDKCIDLCSDCLNKVKAFVEVDTNTLMFESDKSDNTK